MALRAYTTAAPRRLDSVPARLLPVATIAVAALLSILPVRIPGYAALTPAFTLMAVYHWSIYRPDRLPAVALFVIGAAQDILSGAPIGVTALLLLLARAGVVRYRRHFVNRLFPFVWAGFTLLAGTAMFGLWALQSVLHWVVLDLRSTVFRVVLSVAIFPVASILLGRTQRALMGAG